MQSFFYSLCAQPKIHTINLYTSSTSHSHKLEYDLIKSYAYFFPGWRRAWGSSFAPQRARMPRWVPHHDARMQVGGAKRRAAALQLRAPVCLDVAEQLLIT